MHDDDVTDAPGVETTVGEEEVAAVPAAKPVPDRDTCRRIIEGALLASGETLTVERLGTLFEDHERPAEDEIRALLAEIAANYEGHGVELKEVASGFRIQVRKEFGPWVSRLWTEKPPRYSRALLETLALIAYRQPITRGEIEEIRGVTVSSEMVKSLIERDWIRVVGHRDVPGRPALYATTHDFLDYFDLKSLDELPTLSELRDLDRVNPELQFEAPPTEMLVIPATLAPGEAELATAADAGTGSDAGAAAVASGLAEPEDDQDHVEDMKRVDEVLKKFDDEFRRKEAVADSDGLPAGDGQGTPGPGAS